MCPRQAQGDAAVKPMLGLRLKVRAGDKARHRAQHGTVVRMALGDLINLVLCMPYDLASLKDDTVSSTSWYGWRQPGCCTRQKIVISSCCVKDAVSVKYTSKRL